MSWHYGHLEKVIKENRQMKLMKHLMDYCNKNLSDHLDDSEYLEKNNNEVNNYMHVWKLPKQLFF